MAYKTGNVCRESKQDILTLLAYFFSILAEFVNGKSQRIPCNLLLDM